MRDLPEPRFTVKTGMLVWNPDSDQVTVVSWPDYGRVSRGYRMSCLACNSTTRSLNPAQRKGMAFIEAIHLIVRDNVCPKAVHNAMLDIKEYRDGCSEDMQRKF
jgi:hypothetical protein